MKRVIMNIFLVGLLSISLLFVKQYQSHGHGYEHSHNHQSHVHSHTYQSASDQLVSTSTPVMTNNLIKMSSIDDVLDVPFRQFQRGLLLNLLNSNLIRYGNYKTMLNLNSKNPFSIKPIVHPQSDDKTITISVFLFASKENSITETQVIGLTDGLLVEIQNTFGYFKKNVDFSMINGRFEERLPGDQQGRSWDLAKVIKALQVKKALANFSRQIISMAKVENLMRLGRVKQDDQLRKKHLEALKQIIKLVGWPTIQLVGSEASHMAWSIVQNADHDIPYQKLVLNVLKEAKDGQILKSEIAYLTDRILVNEGKNQLYGTQYEVDAQGNIIPKPIESLDKVDQRRKEFGLVSFSEYLANLKKTYQKTKKNL